MPGSLEKPGNFVPIATKRSFCGRDHPPLKKEKRNVFVVGDIEEIRGDFQSLMKYCATDVAATSQVLKVLYPLFRQRCPHPATLGMCANQL